jgi:hypothetical protein
MSLLLAAGCALSRDQCVSVVPTIQCRLRGMTNSTEVGVRRIRPLWDWIRSRGTTRWVPLLARELPTFPHHRLSLISPDARGVQDLPGTDLQVLTRFEITDPHSGDALALTDETCYARAVCDQRTVGDSGVNQEHRMARVVDLGVVVVDGADQRVLAHARHQRQRLTLGEVVVARHPAGGARNRREPVVQRQPGCTYRRSQPRWVSG